MPLRVRVPVPALVTPPVPEIVEDSVIAALLVKLNPEDVLMAPAVSAEAVTLSCPTSLEAPTAPPMLTEPAPALILTTEGVALVSRT